MPQHTQQRLSGRGAGPRGGGAVDHGWLLLRLRTSIGHSRASIDRRGWIYSRSERIFHGTPTDRLHENACHTVTQCVVDKNCTRPATGYCLLPTAVSSRSPGRWLLPAPPAARPPLLLHPHTFPIAAAWVALLLTWLLSCSCCTPSPPSWRRW
eukprot:COSAG01_NODE_7196_length_3308_cov_16.219071_1_plen_152_part_10